MKRRVAAIVGPTSVGKTTTAIAVAERLGAEIVSVDSMQIYRGMDIGTDKATPEMRARVCHHLIDVKDPSEDVTVAEFQGLARAAIDDIVARGKVPLLVGGSGLYFRAVVDQLAFPPTAPEVRNRLQEEADHVGVDVLYERLQGLDPPAAARIERSNLRRIVRALEVIELTGRRFSDNDSWDRYDSIYDLRAVGLQRSREQLDARIAARAQAMLESGLMAEASALAERGLGRTARMALGYRQVLDAPGAPRAQLAEDVARATKRFARRQESWFRADPRIAWLDAEAPDVVDRATELLDPAPSTARGKLSR